MPGFRDTMLEYFNRVWRLGRDLHRGFALDLGLDPDRATYIPLAALATATEKARRDAPAIAVCEV